MLYLPTALDSTARTVLVGFGSGVVRALLLCSGAWKVIASFQPHSGMLQPHLQDFLQLLRQLHAMPAEVVQQNSLRRAGGLSGGRCQNPGPLLG